MRARNINEIENAERQNMTNETLTDDELKGVSGGVRTNGDNPFVNAVLNAYYRQILPAYEICR